MDDAIKSEIAEGLNVAIPVLILYLCIIGSIVILGFINYVLRGIAIYRMSVNRGIENGWLGFIPYAYNYQLGQLSGEIELGSKKIKNTGIWLLVMPIIYGFVFSAGYAVTMVSFFFRVFSLGRNPMPEEVFKIIPTFIISMIIFVLILLAAQVFLYLFKYLALHKIFSQYNTGQKPVFYLILSMFVPMAEPILLFMHSNKPLINRQFTMNNEQLMIKDLN